MFRLILNTVVVHFQETAFATMHTPHQISPKWYSSGKAYFPIRQACWNRPFSIPRFRLSHQSAIRGKVGNVVYDEIIFLPHQHRFIPAVAHCFGPEKAGSGVSHQPCGNQHRVIKALSFLLHLASAIINCPCASSLICGHYENHPHAHWYFSNSKAETGSTNFQ
jgi:hypothetical protein